MHEDCTDYFGTDAQQALLRRGRAMHELTKADHRFGYYGRTVGVIDTTDESLDRLIALTEFQGNAFLLNVPDPQFGALSDEARARGMVVNPYDRWIGEDAAITVAREIVATTPLPADLSLVWIDADTPTPVLTAFARMALACGVLPPSLAIFRQGLKPGLCCVAVDREGSVVSCAAVAAAMHPEHPEGRTETWWGMLATDPSRRGERLSLILGAEALLASHARFGFTRFYTGVASGNAPSEAVCTKLGFARASGITLTMADPRLLPGGRMTK